MAHKHDHDFGQERNRETVIVTVVGAVTNLVLSVVKIVIGYIGQSQALIADGIHSLSDLMSDGLILFASHHANQGPDAEHPYGHGRFETAATLALGILLLLVALGIGWDAIERLLSQEEQQIPTTIALFAAIFSILANEMLFWYTLYVGKKINSKMLIANAWHSRSDALSSIVVFVGIGGTQLGVSNLDTIAAIIVSVMIAKMGWQLGWQALEELVDKSLDSDEVEKVSNVIDSVDGVKSVHMLRTRRSGHMSAADVHILVDPQLSVSEGHMIAVAVEDELKKNIDHLSDVTVHIDPEDDEESPPCEGLPLRAEVLKILAEVWQEQDCLSDEAEVKLHYLSGKIDVDLLVPITCFQSVEHSRDIRESLNKKIFSDERFGNIEIYYKAPN